jgi:hypothetical protein
MDTTKIGMKHVKTLLLIVVPILLINLYTQMVSGESELSIPLWKSPKIDGSILKNEYPVVQLDKAWVKLYIVHDESKLVFGMILVNKCIKVDLLFNTGPLEATSLSTSTLRYTIKVSGEVEYYYGSGNRWIPSPLSEVSIKVVNRTNTWVAELSIPLGSLTIFPNKERKLGFALVAYEKNLNYSWPQEASLYNPSTWGAISSPDNWATRNDICVDVFLDKERVIAGSNVTIIMVIRNEGDAPIPDYHLRIWLDNRLIEDSAASRLGLKTPLEKEDRVNYEKKVIGVSEGNHTVKVNVTGVGLYCDFDEKNNEGKRSFLAVYAKIEVSGMPGVSIELEGESQTIGEDGTVLFYSTAGKKRIRVQGIYSPLQGLRYVFTMMKYDNSVLRNPELILNVDGDFAITVEHRKEYLVNLSFVDKYNAFFSPSFYACIFPNGTYYNGTLTRLWLTSGDLSIRSVYYAGLNVLEETKVYDVHEPKEIEIVCKVLGGSVRIVDPFSTPVEGAEVTAVFLNKTQVKYVTDSKGMVSMRRVAGGKVKLIISHLGYSTTVDVDFSTEEEAIIRIPISLNIIIIMVVLVSVIIVTILLKLFSHKIFRRRKEQTYAREEEYEFEEV